MVAFPDRQVFVNQYHYKVPSLSEAILCGPRLNELLAKLIMLSTANPLGI